MRVTLSENQSNRDWVLLSNISWKTLEKLDIDLGETGARLIYLDGSLQIMSPLSDNHEEPKKH